MRVGYQVVSIAAVRCDTAHTHFVYFIPGSYLENEWVNEWFGSHFNTIAVRLGPAGVIVAPLVGREREYRESFETRGQIGAELVELGESFREDWRAATRHVLHTGWPLLVVSQRAFDPDDDRRENADFAIVNLSTCSEPQLARLVDGLIERSQTNRDLVPALEDLTRDWARPTGLGSLAAWIAEEGLELKPNLFGIGLNVNAIAAWYRRRRMHPHDPPS